MATSLHRMSSPPLIMGRLLLGAAPVVLSAVLLSLILAYLALGSAVAARVGRLSIVAALLAGGVLTVLLSDVVRRTAPLYRLAVRRGGEPTPPSRAAVRDAFASPHRAGMASAVTFGVVALIEAIGLTDLSRLAAQSRLSAVLMVLGAGLLTYGPLAVWTRRSLQPWMLAYHADNLVVTPGPRTGTALMREVGLAVSAVGLFLLAALIAALPAELWPRLLAPILLVGGFVLASVTVAASLWERARGAQFDRELASLGRRIHDHGTRLGAGSVSMEEGLAREDDGHVAARVAEEIDGLVGRFSATQTAEVMARQSVQELQKKKMLFMASMSHDLRAPLNSILGFTELLSSESEGSLSDGQRQSVEAIRQSGVELLRLLNDVLDSARFQAGRLELRREWTPLVEILTEAVRQGHELIVGTNLEIVTELQPGLPPVHVDRDRIVQAVVGLFGHAVRAMGEGTIRLRAHVAGGIDSLDSQVRVVVLDSSAGVRAEDRERIFQAFREVAEPSGKRIGGLGLGLSLARALVTAHGGDVSCESREHEGTTFTVSLPLSGPEPARQRRTPRFRRRGQGSPESR